jgi:hypothetical protein
MRNKISVTLIVIGLGMMLSANAFAEGSSCSMSGLCNSIGGFLYNALPWNWGNWVGK